MADFSATLEKMGVKVIPAPEIKGRYEAGQVALDSATGWEPVFEAWETGDKLPARPRDIIAEYRSWIYTCANKNATVIACLPMKLYAKKRKRGQKLLRPAKSISRATLKYLTENSVCAKAVSEGEEIVEILDHPFLDLMANVNSEWNGVDALEQTQTYMELCGMAYWLIESGDMGTPGAFWVLPTQHVKPRWDKTGAITGYILGYPPDEQSFKPEEVIFFRQPSPLHSVLGYGPGYAGYYAAQLQGDVEDFERKMFKNRAIPGGLIVPEQPLTEGQAKQLTDEWNRLYRGIANSGKVGLAPFKVDFKTMAINPADLTRLADRKVTREEIANVFGVPTTLLETSASRAEAEGKLYQYMLLTIVPRIRRLEAKLNERLIPLYGDDALFCAFDNPIPIDREYALRRATALSQTSEVARVREVRDAFDLPPDDELDEQVLIRAQPTFPGQPGQEEKPNADQATVGRTGEGKAGKAHVTDRKLRTVLREIFHEQRIEVLAGLEPKHAKGITGEPFDREKWNTRIAIDARPFIERDLALGAEQGATAIPGGIAWDISRPEVEEFIRNYVYRFAVEVNDTTIAQLREVFITATQEGMTASEIADEVGGVFDNAERYRSMMIARTEGSRAAHAGEDAAWRESGVVKGVYWLANVTACEFCLEMQRRYGKESGAFIALGGNFAALGETITGTDGGNMRVTYEDVPYPPLHPNCQCSRLAVLEED